MKDCEHSDFAVECGVHRLTDDAGVVRDYVAEIRIHCTVCKEQFHFLCRDTGYAMTKPTVNVGATTLHAPIAPGEAALPSVIRFDIPSIKAPS